MPVIAPDYQARNGLSRSAARAADLRRHVRPAGRLVALRHLATGSGARFLGVRRRVACLTGLFAFVVCDVFQPEVPPVPGMTDTLIFNALEGVVQGIIAFGILRLRERSRG